MIKKILKYTGFTLIGLFFALLLAPFVFKDDIIAGIKNALQDKLNAKTGFESVDISFIKSFPDLQVQIYNLSIAGVDTFDEVELLKLEVLSIDLNLVDIIFGEKTPAIDYIGLKNGRINVLILPDGMANYSIMKEDTTQEQIEASTFSLEISKYNLSDIELTYVDQSMPMYVHLTGIEHTGKGDFTTTVFDLQTDTKADSLTVRYDGSEYISNAKISMEAAVNINTDEMSFTLKDNILALNELNLTGDGMVRLYEDSIAMDIHVTSEKEDIRHLLSAIPSFYTSDFPKIKTSGEATVALDLHGVYDGKENRLPGFQFATNISKGYIQYPSSPVPLKDLNLDLKVSAKDPQYKDMAVHIPVFSCTVLNDRVEGNLLINNAMTNQTFSGLIKGTINLANIKQALHLNSFEKLQGIIQGNLQFKALMQDIVQENYVAIDAKGNVSGKQIYMQANGKPSIAVASLESQFSPKTLTWNAHDLKVDEGKYQFSGSVSNPLAFFTMEKGVEGKLVLQGDVFNMNHWTSDTESAQNNPEESTTAALSKKQTSFVQKSSMGLDIKIGKILAGQNEFDDVNVKADIKANLLHLDQLQAKFAQNDIRLHGVINNVYDYVFSNGILQGEMYLSSNQLNANNLLSASPESQNTAITSPYQVPERMDIVLHADIESLTYTDMNLKNVKGDFTIKNKEATISGLTTETLGGKIGLEGLYNTSVSNQPDYSLKLDLSKIKFAEAFKKITIFKKLVPVAEYIDGIFNTTLVMKGKLKETMSPDLASLDASGFIETLQGRINAFPPLLKIGNTLQIKELKNIDLTDTKNWFDIVQGVVDIKPWKIKAGEIPMEIKGKHSFANGMDFNITMDIPRKLLEKSSITQTANSGLSFLESESKKLGIPFSQGESIPVLVTLKGKLSSPSISIKPIIGGGGNSSGQILKDNAQTIGQTAKDSLAKILKKEKQKAQDTIQKVISREKEKLQTKAEEGTKKVLDEAKEKAKEKLDTLTKGVIQDTLKKKAEDILNKNVDKEIDKIKDKLKDFDPFKKKKDKN